MKYTIKDFRKQFPDDKACLAFLYKNRYPRGAKCDKCAKKNCFYPIAGRKAYVCSWCGHQLSPTARTIFHKSPTPLILWFHAIFLFATAKSGVSGKEVQRQLGVTYKCAWRICRQIRLLMSEDGYLLGGVTDEFGVYNKVESAGYAHAHMKHSAGQSVRGAARTQAIDGFWSQFKRSVNGAYHSVSPKHLPTYLDEFCFRYGRRVDACPLPVTLLSRVGLTSLGA